MTRELRIGRWEGVWWGWRAALNGDNYRDGFLSGRLDRYFCWSWGPVSVRRYD